MDFAIASFMRYGPFSDSFSFSTVSFLVLTYGLLLHRWTGLG